LKRVLIITYYWPPAGGVAVQRWVKMAKYLRSYGWEPIIYTAENGETPVIDKALLAEIPADITVIKQPIWEPYTLYKSLLGYKKGENINAAFLQERKKHGFFQNMSIWIRGNFFIPDARKFWIKPSIRYLANYLKSEPVDAIISTGPPHSMHLIAKELKKMLHIPWVADFRDPWTNIDYYNDLKLTSWADKKHRALEQKVLLEADKVVTVSAQWAAEFNAINNNTLVVTNGYDESDFETTDDKHFPGFALHHVGMINKARNPEFLWKALGELCNGNAEFNSDLQIHLTGKTDHLVLADIEKYGLSDKVTQHGQVTHKVAIRAMQNSPVLLLLLNDTQDIMGRIPAKLFEYFAAKRPVLAVGNVNGDAAKIINETGAGIVTNFNDLSAIKAAIMSLYNDYKNGVLSVNIAGIEKYSRKNIAAQYAEILNKL
jgi:glycosyltransferase involved in cell wall biosynthesis